MSTDPGAGNPTGTATAALNIGSRNNAASLGVTGDYAEILLAGSITDTQRDNYESYLISKWSLP